MLRSPLNRACHAFLSPINLTASNFGSLELKPRADTEFIGQPIDYSDDKTLAIQQISLDALTLPADTDVNRALAALGTRHTPLAVIAGSRVVGLLSQLDVMKWLQLHQQAR